VDAVDGGQAENRRCDEMKCASDVIELPEESVFTGAAIMVFEFLEERSETRLASHSGGEDAGDGLSPSLEFR
jgi:hypothetical protein